jgi:hypothetical protein
MGFGGIALVESLGLPRSDAAAYMTLNSTGWRFPVSADEKRRMRWSEA